MGQKVADRTTRAMNFGESLSTLFLRFLRWGEEVDQLDLPIGFRLMTVA